MSGMCEDVEREQRLTLLAYVERHWRELSLREASRLTCEAMERSRYDADSSIKDTLTFS